MTLAVAIALMMYFERCMTFRMCRALVEACTPDEIQVDPFAAEKIQKSCVALALALK